MNEDQTWHMGKAVTWAVIVSTLLLVMVSTAGHAEDVPLREYLETRIEEQDRRVEQAQESSRLAIAKAEAAIGERLILLNEFRDQSKDQAQRYATREMLDAMNQRIAALESSRDTVYGGILIVALIGVVNLVKLFWGGR